MLSVPEHPLPVARAVDERDRLDEVFPGEMDEVLQVSRGHGVGAGDLRMPFPAGRFALDDRRIHFQTSHHSLDQLPVERDARRAWKPMRAPETEGRPVLD